MNVNAKNKSRNNNWKCKYWEKTVNSFDLKPNAEIIALFGVDIYKFRDK